MSDLLDLVVDTFPANNDVGVPLITQITLTLSGLDYDTTSLEEGFFVEGPDTDQFIGPGLLELTENVSQGDVEDFLGSPGYAGIVKGTTTVSGIAGNTVVTFTPDIPLAPELLYVANLSSVLDAAENEIEGFISFSFETGTGSIEVIPSTVSSSVLSGGIPEDSAPASADSLSVVSVNPEDRSIQNSTELAEITVTFNKAIDPASVDPSAIKITTVPVTNHPSANTRSLGDLAKTIEVEGKKLKLKI